MAGTLKRISSERSEVSKREAFFKILQEKCLNWRVRELAKRRGVWNKKVTGAVSKRARKWAKGTFFAMGRPEWFPEMSEVHAVAKSIATGELIESKPFVPSTVLRKVER